MPTAALDLKENALALARLRLRSFLDTGSSLSFRRTENPRVSVITLLCNRAELTLGCLFSLASRLNRTSMEIIVVDNGSTDETGRLLERIDGLTVIRNEKNLGYPKAVNQAACAASGDYLLLLNNDTEVLGRSIDQVVDFMDSHADVGAAGGKIIHLDGTLQEAGCSIWRDGWGLSYGRNDLPDVPAYNFQRDVDYCSGAFLITPRKLFQSMGGLDEIFSPGYFEDPDYCIRLRQSGCRIVYVPDAAILHFENATSSSILNVSELMKRNHGLFMAKHGAWLSANPPREWPVLCARTANSGQFNVLMMADEFVRSKSGEPSPIEYALSRIHRLGGFITLCYSEDIAAEMQPILERLPRTVETLCLNKIDWTEPRLATRLEHYDLVVAAEAEVLRPLLPRTSSQAGLAVIRDGRFTLLEERQFAASPSCVLKKSA